MADSLTPIMSHLVRYAAEIILSGPAFNSWIKMYAFGEYKQPLKYKMNTCG